MRVLAFCAVAWLWPFLAGAQGMNWVIPGSATDAVRELLGDLAPELTYRSASVQASRILVEACPPSGACVTFELTHMDGCQTPAGPFCVTYHDAATPVVYRAAIEGVLAEGRHDDFWKLRKSRGRKKGEASGATYRVPMHDPRPRPEGVPSPWAVALSSGLLLCFVAITLADRWQARALRRRLVVPVLFAVASAAVWVSGRPVVWSVFLSLVFFSLVFGWRCLERSKAISVAVTGMVLLGVFELGMLAFDLSLLPDRTRAYRFADDPVLDGRLSGVPNPAGVCQALGSDDLLSSLGGRSVLHVASEREPASIPLVHWRRLPMVAVPGDAYLRAERARELLKRHRPRTLVLHLEALADLRQWGAPLPCCGGRAPFRLEDGTPRFACSQGTGEPTPPRFALLAARSRVPVWLEEFSHVSALAGAVDRAAAQVRQEARGSVPTTREAINTLAHMYRRLADEARRADSELVVVLEPDLVAFSSPVPHLTVERRYHSALAHALASQNLTVVDLWAALDAADDDRPWELVDHGELTEEGKQVVASALHRSQPMATPAGDGDLRP